MIEKKNNESTAPESVREKYTAINEDTLEKVDDAQKVNDAENENVDIAAEQKQK